LIPLHILPMPLIIDNHIYAVRHKTAGTLLDCLSGNNNEQATVGCWADMQTAIGIYEQLWQFVPIAGQSGVYNIINVRGGRGLDNWFGNFSNGSKISCCGITGNNNQRWLVEPAEISGYWRFKNVQSATFLDLDCGSSANGARVQGWAGMTGNSNQMWSLERFSRTAQEMSLIYTRDQYVNAAAVKIQTYHPNGIFLHIPKAVRDSIWSTAALVANQLRGSIYDSSQYAASMNGAVAQWAQGYIRINNISMLFGEAYAQNADPTQPGRAFSFTLNMASYIDTIDYYDPVTGVDMPPKNYSVMFATY